MNKKRTIIGLVLAGILATGVFTVKNKEEPVGGSELWKFTSSLLQPVVSTWNISAPADLRFDGDLLPDGSDCAAGEILKKTGADNWDCAADTGGVSSNSLDFDEFVPSMTLDTNTTITNNGFAFTITNASVSNAFEVGGYASASKYFGVAFGTTGDCNDSTEGFGFDLTTGLFSCRTLAVADVSATGGTGVDITTNDFTFDSTEIEATTWGAGGNATNIWTHNLSAGDPTLTWTQSGASLSLNFEADRFVGVTASISHYRLPISTGSGALGDCDAAGDTLNWDTTTGDFSCGTDASGSVSSNSLDFDEFVPLMVLDTNTSISFSTFNLEFNLTSTGDFIISDNNTDHFFTAWDTGGVSISHDFEVGSDLFRVFTNLTAPDIIFSVASSSGTNMFIVASSGHVISKHDASPTISCTAGSPTVEAGSTDVAGEFTAGAAATACTLTFKKPWTVAPSCIGAVDGVTGLALGIQTTTTTAVFNSASIGGVLVNYICLGFSN